MSSLRTVGLALVLVAAQGCRSDTRKRADKAADKVVELRKQSATMADATAVFQARRELRYRALEAQLSVIATQPPLISAMADAFPLTEAGRADVTDKLQTFQMRLDEARNQIALVRASLVDYFKDADDKATAAMSKLDAARKDAWTTLDKAPRTDRSS